MGSNNYYMQRIGQSSCIRCEFETNEKMSFAEQDAAMMAHLVEKHPDWMTEPLTRQQEQRLAEKRLTPDQRRIIELEQQVARLSASVTHIEYDSECGSAYIYFQPERKGEPAVVAETVVANLDIDNEGRIYGIEVLDLSEKEATVLLAARVSASSDVKGDGDGK